jgi:hypothetical protein
MAYSDHFTLADDMISHLDSVTGGITDPFVASRYVGFVAVAAVTVYELAIKEIFCEFAQKKHNVFGNFVHKYFDRINGRIALKAIREDYIPRFGDRYVQRFKKNVKEADENSIKAHQGSITSSYSNIIVWRNKFAHEGKIPSTPTYEEVKKAYFTGKSVIDCLANTMRR